MSKESLSHQRQAGSLPPSDAPPLSTETATTSSPSTNSNIDKYANLLFGISGSTTDRDSNLQMERMRFLRYEESQDDSTSGGGDFADSGSEECDMSDSERKAFKIPRDPRLEAYEDLTNVQVSCLNFAMEHRIFLKAILGLLAERDKKATEIGMNDPNTLKSGPLKKASHLLSGVWKVKFVEVRRGMFSYYEDAVSGDKSAGSLLRKNLPLDASTCSCRAVKIHRNGLNMATGGAIFELKIDNMRRLWLAKSRAERLAWIQAINDAMVGGSVTLGSVKEQHGKSGTVSRRSPYQKHLRQYLKMKSALRNSVSKIEYVSAMRELLGSPLEIPVQWLMEQIDMPSNTGVGSAFHEADVYQGVEQLWRDLLRDTLQINGELFHGDSGHGPEKIIGALSRNIVIFSRSSNPATSAKYKIPESKAIAYARDILLSVNRTRSGGDSYFCIDTLCKNSDLIVTVPSSSIAEPLSISVEVDDTDDPTEYSVNDKSGWVRTRNRIQKSWRMRYLVLSEGTLSLYRHETPRPHGLRGQMVVTGASIGVDRSKDDPGNYNICIETKDGLKDRWLYFTNKFKLLQWAYALELTAKGTSMPQRVVGRLGLRSPRDAKAEPSSSEDHDIVEESMKGHAKQIGVTREEFDERVARYSAKNNSRVKVSVQASSEYNICTTDPQGDGGDTWGTLSATFLQTFRISGDRIARGEELVRVEVIKCPEPVTFSQALNFPGDIASPSSPRKKLGLRTRLTNS